MTTAPILIRHTDKTPTEHSAAAPWSEAVETRAPARWLHLSGQVPPVIDAAQPIESLAAYGDMEAQARGVLSRVQRKLAAAGFGLGDVVKITGYLVGEERFGDRPDLDGFGRAWREVFADDTLPARTRVQVVRLMNPAWLVEIEAVAAKQECHGLAAHPSASLHLGIGVLDRDASGPSA